MSFSQSIKSIWLLLLLISNLYAAPVPIAERDSDVSILEHSTLFVEKNVHREHPKEPKTDGAYKPFGSDFASLGYMSDEAVWVRFELKNTTEGELTREIHIDNSMLDSITLYEEGVQPRCSGVFDRGVFDGILDFHFTISLKPQETKVYYLRVFSNSCATYFHISAKTKDSLWLYNNKREMILTFFAAAMIALTIYNGFIYAFTRERVYLYYVLFLIFTIYNHFFSYTGMGLSVYSHLGASESFISVFLKIDAYLGVYYMLFVSATFLLFFGELINSKRYKTINKAFQVFFALYLFFGVISALNIRYSLDWAVYLCFVMLVYILCIIVYLVYKKEENSIYLLVGQGINISGFILFFLFNTGDYTPQGGYWYFYEMSLTAEAFLFSIVLSKKLAKTKALENALSTQRILTRELHHRVKNNLQFIVSLYRLKLKKHLDETGKTMLAEAEQNIRSIGKIHEILYRQQNISRLSAKEYFGDLADEIKRGYSGHFVDIRIEGDIQIAVEQAIYCGIIINELVTNALKYAFDENGGRIDIKLSETGGQKSMTVADNGRGYDVDAPITSFGLSLVQKLTEDELKGSISSTSKDGITHILRWS